MGDRRVFYPEFGAFLVKLREARKWSQSQAAEVSTKPNKIPLTRQALRGLEEGRTKHPDASLLRAVAALYGVTYDALVFRFVESHYGVSPGGRSETTTPTPPDVAIGSEDEAKLILAWRSGSPDTQGAAWRALGLPANERRRSAPKKGRAIA